MSDRLTCFVAMPFSESSPTHTEAYWTDHFERFLKRLIESSGRFAAKRSTPLRGDLRNEIVADLITASVVCADLTDANPNVYWELGVRQSFRHGTITIAEQGTRLPFDVSGKGTLFYHPQNHVRMVDFEEQLQAALRSCIDEPGRADSLVLEGLSGRGSIYEIIRKDEAIRRLQALIAELKYNLQVLRNVQATISRNKEIRDARSLKRKDAENDGDVPSIVQEQTSTPTTLLRTACCELLITTRYMDADNEFYREAEVAYSRSLNLNGQIGVWDYRPEGTEKYLEPLLGERIEQLSKLVGALEAQLERAQTR